MRNFRHSSEGWNPSCYFLLDKKVTKESRKIQALFKKEGCLRTPNLNPHYLEYNTYLSFFFEMSVSRQVNFSGGK